MHILRDSRHVYTRNIAVYALTISKVLTSMSGLARSLDTMEERRPAAAPCRGVRPFYEDENVVNDINGR